MPTNRRSPWVWLGTSLGMVVAATVCGAVQGAAEERPQGTVVAMQRAASSDVARGGRAPDLREPAVDAQPVGRGEIVIRPTGRKVRVVSLSGQERRVTTTSPATSPVTQGAAVQRDVKSDGTEYTERGVRLPLAYDPRENFTGVYGAELNLPLGYGAAGCPTPYYGGGILSYFGHGPGYGYGHGYGRGGRHYGYGGGFSGCDYGSGFGGYHRPAEVSRPTWTPLAGVGGAGGSRSWSSSSSTTTARWTPR